MTLLAHLPALRSDPAPGFLERREQARTTVGELRTKLADLQTRHDHALVEEVMGDPAAKTIATKLRAELVAVESQLQDEERLLERFDRAERLVLRTSAEAQFDEIERRRIEDRKAWFGAIESALPTMRSLAQALDVIGDVEDRDRRSRQSQESLVREFELDRPVEQTVAGAVPSGGVYFEGMVKEFQAAVAQAERNGLRPRPASRSR